jgi:hypothetical protein
LDVDAETGQVLTVRLHAVEIPPDRPLKEFALSIAYEKQKIGDAEYLLPVRSESRINIYGLLVKAETEFKEYRKFSAASEITFEP